MNIPVNEKYVITADRHNWILNEKLPPDSKDKKKIRPVAYHGKLEHLINSLLEREVRLSDAGTFNELKALYFTTQAEIKDMVTQLPFDSVYDAGRNI